MFKQRRYVRFADPAIQFQDARISRLVLAYHILQDRTQAFLQKRILPLVVCKRMFSVTQRRQERQKQYVQTISSAGMCAAYDGALIVTCWRLIEGGLPSVKLCQRSQSANAR